MEEEVAESNEDKGRKKGGRKILLRLEYLRQSIFQFFSLFMLKVLNATQEITLKKNYDIKIFLIFFLKILLLLFANFLLMNILR
jgi:hypothetical protein